MPSLVSPIPVLRVGSRGPGEAQVDLVGSFFFSHSPRKYVVYPFQLHVCTPILWRDNCCFGFEGWTVGGTSPIQTKVGHCVPFVLWNKDPQEVRVTTLSFFAAARYLRNRWRR